MLCETERGHDALWNMVFILHIRKSSLRKLSSGKYYSSNHEDIDGRHKHHNLSHEKTKTCVMSDDCRTKCIWLVNELQDYQCQLTTFRNIVILSSEFVQ
jgi:hypothetical protein